MSITAVVFDPYSEKELISPLVKVYNMTVFERTIRSLLSVGINNILIIGESNSAKFTEILAQKGLASETIQLLQPDGLKTAISELKDILLLSQSLLLTPRYITETIEAGTKEGAIASDPNKYLLYINEGGASQLKSDISSDLTKLVKSAKEKGLKAITTESIGRYVCEPVPDKKSLKQARGRLIRSLRQPSDEFISRTFNRPISLMITSVIAYTPITANQYTIITGILGLITAYILSLGGDQNFFIGGIMFHFLCVMDAGDGEIARLKFLASERGQWIDTIVDNVTYVATLLGLIVGVFRSEPNDFVIYSSMVGVAFLLLALLSLYIYLFKYNKGGSLLNIDYSFKSDEGLYGKLMNILQELGRRPFFSVVFMFLGIFGIMELSLVYVSLMTFPIFVFSLQAHIQTARHRA